MNEPIKVRDGREKAISVLTDAFSKDDLPLEEFESRLTRVHNAATVEEIKSIVADLPGHEKAIAPVRVRPLPPAEAQSSQTLLAIIGGTERKGSWTAAERMFALSLVGGTHLDFREARLPPGVIELNVYAIMGGVEIIVPPDLPVETHGIGIMGGFVQLDRAPQSPDVERSVLRISGVAFMGGVHVETRLPGESSREARKRLRAERKALKSGG
jgi:hypothetical protein